MKLCLLVSIEILRFPFFSAFFSAFLEAEALKAQMLQTERELVAAGNPVSSGCVCIFQTTHALKDSIACYLCAYTWYLLYGNQ